GNVIGRKNPQEEDDHRGYGSDPQGVIKRKPIHCPTSWGIFRRPPGGRTAARSGGGVFRWGYAAASKSSGIRGDNALSSTQYSLIQRREAHAFKHRRSLVGLEIGQKRLGGLFILGDVQHRRWIDHLAAHLRRGLRHHRQTVGKGIRGVDDAAVHRRLRHLAGDLLDVGAVGQHAGVVKRRLVQAVIGKDLLGILAYRYVAVA